MGRKTNGTESVLFTQTEVDILKKVATYKQDCWGIYHNVIDIDRTLAVEIKETVRLAFLSGISAGMAFEPRGDNKHLLDLKEKE